jgi:hypothetical protein
MARGDLFEALRKEGPARVGGGDLSREQVEHPTGGASAASPSVRRHDLLAIGALFLILSNVVSFILGAWVWNARTPEAGPAVVSSAPSDLASPPPSQEPVPPVVPPPPSASVGRWTLLLVTYGKAPADKKRAEEARDFLIGKGYRDTFLQYQQNHIFLCWNRFSQKPTQNTHPQAIRLADEIRRSEYPVTKKKDFKDAYFMELGD